jgi:hypothetical protein
MFVQGYKGVAASFTWAPAVVLFGRNDAGKSNILEAIAWAVGIEASRCDPLIGDSNEAAVGMLVELDRIDDDESIDADLLAALLQMRHVPPLFPHEDPDEPHPDPDREQELWGGSILLSQFPGSLLEWDPASDDDVARRRFKIGCVGEIYSGIDPVSTVGSLDQVRRSLRKRALAYANETLEEMGEGEARSWASFERLLDRCLRSRWIVCHTRAGVLWLPPYTEECEPDEIEAAHRLAASFGDDRIPVVDGFIRQLVTGQPISGPFLRTTHNFRPWRVVPVSGSGERLEGLAREVAAFVRSGFEQLLRGGGHAADPWLATNEEGRR